MTTEDNMKPKRQRRAVLLVAAASAVLGLGCAAGIIAATTSGSSSATVVAAGTATPSAPAATPSGSASPSASAAASASPSTSSSATGGSGSTGSTSKSNSSSGSSNSSSSGSSSSSRAPAPAAPAAPAPAPDPQPTACPDSRGANPSLWDACRAGYVAPHIQFAGLLSCTAVDRSTGTWSVTYQLRASGGNYKGYWEGMADNGSARGQITISGVMPDSLGAAIPMSASGNIVALPMNGLDGMIDYISYSDSPTVTLGSVCH